MWREQAVARVGQEAFDSFVAIHADELLAVTADVVAKAEAAEVTNPRVTENLAAIEALKTDGAVEALRKYSGWGGIPADQLAAQGVSPGVGEFYTPDTVADAIGRAVAPLLPGLTDIHGRVHALEPAAGTGALIRGVEAHAAVPIEWTAVEVEPTAAAILGRLHSDVTVYQQQFETWIREVNGQDQFRLVVGNPPFYRAGITAVDDNHEYREAESHAYFLRRCLDVLAPGGLLVMLMPRSFLHAAKYAKTRARVLRRAHLLAAYRLPQRLFHGTDMQVDVVFFRARLMVLPQVHTDDQFIVEPDGYMVATPTHVLAYRKGKLEIPFKETRCEACKPRNPALPAVQPIRPAPGCCAVQAAIHFGARLNELREKIASHLAEARELHRELHRDIADFQQTRGNPWEWRALTRKQKFSSGARGYLDAFAKDGAFAEWFSREPAGPKYRGRPQAIVDQASWLYERTGTSVRVDDLLELHHSVGGQLSRDEAEHRLYASGWARVNEFFVEPDEAYYRGPLERKRNALQLVSEQSRKQARALDELIAAVPIEDIELSPRAGWVPLDRLSQWASELLGHRVTLERPRGLVEALAKAGDKQLEALVRWLNHEHAPGQDPERWIEHFRTWVTEAKARRQQIADAYNRAFRGYLCADPPAFKVATPRWTPSVTLHDFQTPVVRSVLEQGQGLVALDTGLGKTIVALKVLAAARNRGEARRPVIVVPKSLVWKWFDAFTHILPDYRVGVLGSHRCELRGGELERLQAEHRAGVISDLEYENRRIKSRTDSPVSRSAKWHAFEIGAFDAVIMTPSVLEHTAVTQDTIDSYLKTPAIARLRTLGHEFNVEADESDMVWDQVVDFLIVDEAADYRNLFKPSNPPKYMGAGTPSKRARAMHLRAFATRRLAERGGVVLLTATPAKNSPVDVYSLLHIMNPAIWEDAGIYNHQDFIDRYVRVETVPTLSADLEIREQPAVVGFHHMVELRGILCRHMYHKSAEDVADVLALPVPRKHVIEVPLDSRQQAKYEKLRDSSANPLATQVRLSLIAVHADLDEYTWETAEAVPDPTSPKFAAIATKIAENPECGHIVFLENLAAHRWLRSVLINEGIPDERIGMMNGKTAPTSSARLKIAEAFNQGKLHVLIVNCIAYEGIGLQYGTCAVHHGDHPWFPGLVRQRNGRAWRTGNSRPVLEIFYYVATGSTDANRLAQIDGKATSWLRQLVSGKDIIRNPAAALFLDPGEFIRSLARDPESAHTRELLEKADRDKLERNRARIRVDANRLVFRAAARFRDAREGTGDPILDRRRRREAEGLMTEIAKIDKRIWPWWRWLAPIEHVMPLVPLDGSMPVFEGLRVTRIHHTRPQAFEFGRLGIKDGRRVIGIRHAGRATWEAATVDDVAALGITSENLPGNTPVEWPDTDVHEVVAHAQELAPELARTSWPDLLGWHFAADQFVEVAWPQVCKHLIEFLRTDDENLYPVFATDDQSLRLVRGSELGTGALLAPTISGWRLYLQHYRTTNYPAEALQQAAAFWWGRQEDV